MNQHITIYAVLIIFILISCEQKETKNLSKKQEYNNQISTATSKPILVDYKSGNYEIMIGKSYKTSEKIIDWHWSAMADGDGKIDSTGKDAFIYLGEPLIKYNNDKFLASLHIETDKNIITTFTCLILFNLEETPNSVEDFLSLNSENISKLKIDSVRNSIILNGIFETKTKNYNEKFKLTKGKEFEYDKFEYVIKK